MEIKKSLIILIASLLVIKIFASFIDEYSAIIYPIIVSLLLISLVITFFFTKPKISKLAWAFFFISIIIQIFTPHIHLFTPDDYWLMEQGKNTALQGSSIVCELDSNLENLCQITKSTGFSTILAAGFLLFGLGNYIAIFISVIMSSLTILAMYLFLSNYSKQNPATTLFLLVTSSLFIYLSSHVENMSTSILFLLLSATYLIKFCKKQINLYLWISILSFLIIIFIRVELVLFGLAFITIISKIKNWTPIAFGVTVISIFLAQIRIISSIGYNSQFNIANLIANLTYFQISIISLVMVGIAIAGIIELKKKSYPVIIFLVLSLLFYFTWTQTNLYRVLMIPLIAFLILQGAGLNFVMKKNKIIFACLILLILVSASFSYRETIKEIKGDDFRRINTEILSQLSFDDCIVVLERPTFIGIKNVDKMSTRTAIPILHDLAKNNCVVFYENNYCYQNIDPGSGRSEEQMDSIKRCKKIKANNLTLIEEYNFKYKYRLWKVNV